MLADSDWTCYLPSDPLPHGCTSKFKCLPSRALVADLSLGQRSHRASKPSENSRNPRPAKQSMRKLHCRCQNWLSAAYAVKNRRFVSSAHRPRKRNALQKISQVVIPWASLPHAFIERVCLVCFVRVLSRCELCNCRLKAPCSRAFQNRCGLLLCCGSSLCTANMLLELVAKRTPGACLQDESTRSSEAKCSATYKCDSRLDAAVPSPLASSPRSGMKTVSDTALVIATFGKARGLKEHKLTSPLGPVPHFANVFVGFRLAHASFKCDAGAVMLLLA